MSADSEQLFKGFAEHVYAAPAGVELIEPTFPEVAFIGRSNVGKSSLINAVLGRKKLARTSNTPGATRAIHFYNLDSRCYVVDLPGYGYAKMSKTESAALAVHISDYLADRPTLKTVCVLVDTRHGFKDSDKDMIEQLAQYGVASIVVLTKADKLKPKQQAGVLKHVAADMETIIGPTGKALLTSSETGLGIEELREVLYTSLSI